MSRYALLLLLTASLVLACDVAIPDREDETLRPTSTPPDSLHIVTLGDSLAYGAGDESGEGIAGRIRLELERAGVEQVETTNLGVNGAQTGDLMQRLRQQRVRQAVAGADAVVLSIGANDLFRSPGAREETLRAPLAVAERILGNIEQIVADIHSINPEAHVLILGGYNPVPGHAQAAMIEQYLGLWDAVLASRFQDDHRIEVVTMSDLVSHDRLSRLDSFHPGGEAYQAAAQRIAEMLARGTGTASS
jgi:lysophospholipase L1-like esterase